MRELLRLATLHLQCPGHSITLTYPGDKRESLATPGRGSRPRSKGCRACLRALLMPIAVLCSPINTHSAHAQASACASEAAPSEQLGGLFRDVQLSGIFADGKTFADLQYQEAPRTILADYQAHKNDPDFDLKQFVQRHFSIPPKGRLYRPPRRTNRSEPI